MGVVAGALYAALAVALVGAGATLRARESMAGVPLYDADAAADPAALARVLGASLVAFGAVTLAFAALEVVDLANAVVVVGYAVVVLAVALVTATRTRQYE